MLVHHLEEHFTPDLGLDRYFATLSIYFYNVSLEPFILKLPM